MGTLHPESLDFYLTPEHECSYLPERQAMTLFADPSINISTELYSKLIVSGFRRSGTHVYRPRCPMCDACIPIRLPVDAFTPSRSQRRLWKRNQDISIHITPNEYSHEHFLLYQRYIRQRHAGGGMDNPDPEKYSEFLINPYIDASFVEFRLEGKLLGVAIVDRLVNALSAVYTFFDPSEKSRGLGILAILWQINEAKRLNLDHLYLGYWIKSCQKMDYKGKFRPLETLREGYWHLHDK